ncbi:glycoside hydrolase family 31 protein [Mucilaginibacter pedocola]|uniref:Glycoside hydrolase n=1 Tax=Mucilaginibacter pedocola TaxID=1792845 RepID=A0A1S9P6F4_9SPHI|nr:glycoside hydrolase family 31 protein [Mucilaginibacter pedocola]OOQ56536.1 glycoside hydrolase [Mucilaginibacter pedocola]
MKRFIKFIFAVIIVCAATQLKAQTIITIKDGEQWFGGAVNESQLAPFADGYSLNMYADTKGNQAAPLLLSTKGRFVWSEEPFKFSIDKGKLVINNMLSPLTIDSAGRNLRDAFANASKRFFPSKGKLPDTLLFSKPQYNTWIELVYNQNQQDILKYAHAIIDNGFPPGVLMIDDNWADYYGRFDFRADRFSNAAAMVDRLHRMGFKVMLWVSPFVSPDTEVFRDLLAKKLLLFEGDDAKTWNKAEKPAIISWWNGYSSVLDFTNPAAIEWFSGRLQHMMDTYHLDGFKFDAGDADFYPPNSISYKKVIPNEHSRLWGEVGLRYPLNEYRAMWKMGGQPLVQRLRDKGHNWEDLQKLIPHLTTAGLLGYQFTCTDMIGGGEFGSFIGRSKLDELLVVRSAQCSALMPMMQFSVAPWRVLSAENLAAVKKAVAIRAKYTPYIMALAKAAAATGEPIVRSMEYQFPNQGLAGEKGQFMLGSRFLVAPVLKKDGQNVVHLPKGKWRSDEGKTFKGPCVIRESVAIDRLPVYEFLK